MDQMDIHNKNKLYLLAPERGQSVLFLFLILLAAATGCRPGKIGDIAAPAWSSADPLTVPLRQRIINVEKGNLLVNPSFESGKMIDLDSTVFSYNIQGWKKVGDHVYWVDTKMDTVYSENEVFHGRHSVKVIRETANETDEQGEGIISDYIRVIPGNYLFTYHVRLEDIRSPTSRLGTKIYDGIDIRLLFYDKNKLLISGEMMDPFRDIMIDNSFKGYSFSNLWQIERFGWSRIRGKSANYPFFEGDIPDEAKYIRCFLGLKGSGTMWIDQVDFRFSRWNFTPMEKMEKYFDSSFAKTDLLIPQPKEVRPAETFVYYDPGMSGKRLPAIIVPRNAPVQTRAAGQLLAGHLNRLIHKLDTSSLNHKEISVQEDIQENQIESGGLVFSIGQTGIFQRRYGKHRLENIDGHEQGYVICRDSLYRNLVYLAGNLPAGDYYAATTAIQLFSDTAFTYRHAGIIDYPDFRIRSYPLSRWEEPEQIDADIRAMEKMTSCKLNRAYIIKSIGPEKKQENQIFREGMRRIGQILDRQRVVEPGILIGSCFHDKYLMDQGYCRKPNPHVAEDDHPGQDAEILKTVRHAAGSGIHSFMLFSGYYFPCRKNEMVMCHTVNGTENHAMDDIILKIDRMARKWGTKIQMDIVPPYCFNESANMSRGLAEIYYNDLSVRIPGDVGIVWTGPTLRSLSVDHADYMNFHDMAGKKPVFWDNSLYARSIEQSYGGYPVHYPGKVRMCNLFEPYDVHLPGGFDDVNFRESVFVNGHVSSEIYKIKYATVADYLWNSKDYDPDYSLWKALVLNFGNQTAKHLIFFNEAYYGLLNVCLLIEQKGYANRYIRMGAEFLDFIEEETGILHHRLENNPDLLRELLILKDDLIERFAKLMDAYADN